MGRGGGLGQDRSRGGMCLGQGSGDGEEGEDGKGLCFMARYVPCGEVAVDGDEDDGADGCHDAVAVVVVEDRDAAGCPGRPH